MTLTLLSDDDANTITMERVAVGEARIEDILRNFIFERPDTLPVADIDPSYGRLTPVARELSVPGVGRIDAVFVDEHGRLVIVEAKLWRNPESHRKVVGQILDYAAALAKWDYADLQRQVSAATGRHGNVLHALVQQSYGPVDEARFVDQVSRNLERGRFLLIILGDGITESTKRIGDYLQNQSGLAFDFGMVEIAEYRFNDPVMGTERTILQPRLIINAIQVERTVIRIEGGRVTVEPVQNIMPTTTPSDRNSEAVEQWRSFVERFRQMPFDDPAQPPVKAGALNWMRVPLPPPSSITLWRSEPNQEIGAFITFSGSEGFTLYDLLAEQRDSIDRELVEAGLPAPAWERGVNDASIALHWPSPTPWTEAEEERQMTLMAKAANALVNALRPRLLQLA